MITKEQLEKIKAFAIDLDWNIAFGGKSKGNRHLFRIVSKALELTDGFDCDKTILEAGAWLHDTNLEVTIAGETLANKDKIVNFLQSIGVTTVDSDRIIHCIEAHDGRIPAITVEAKLVHDADTLEKMGPLGVIRETWKRSQLGWTTEQIIQHLKTHLKKRESNIYTEKARKIAARLNKELDNFFAVIDEQINEK